LQYIHAENIQPEIGGCKVHNCHEQNFITSFVHGFNDIDENIDFLRWSSETSETPSDLIFEAGHDSKIMADLLLFAWIGRHFTNNQKTNEQTHPHFKYNFNTKVVRAVHPHCVFEREIYLSMIVLTVVVLIFIILSRHIPSAWKIWKQDIDAQHPTQHATQHATHNQNRQSNAKFNMASRLSGSMPLDFGTANLRQR